MVAYTLIVSDPPHNEVDPLHAMPYLGMSPAEVRMKANYPAPEIWLADLDQGRTEAVAESLRQAGLRVVVLSGDDLPRVPAQSVVKSFSFGEAGLIAAGEGAEVSLGYGTPVTAIFCVPRDPVGGETGRTTASPLTEGLRQRTSSVFMTRDSLVGLGGLGRRSSTAGLASPAQTPPGFFDLYATRDGKLVRLSVLDDRTGFGGLKELELPRAADNLAMFVAEFEGRFPKARLDRRLVNLQARPRPMVTRTRPPDLEGEAFSFVAEGLAKVLESISPELKDVSQFDLSSRLAYLTKR